MSLLTEQEATSVSQAVAEVELSTAGEVVVVVVPQSDDYAYPRAVFALVMAIGCGWVLYWVLPHVHAGILFGGQTLLWALFFGLSGWGVVLRALVSRQRQEQAVDARSKQVFIDEGLTETRDRSGVLILVSETEHRVQILADRGIHERVGTEGWQTHVQAMVAAIRAGHTAEGLCAAIHKIGESLAAAFPPRADDTNELSNEVRYR